MLPTWLVAPVLAVAILAHCLTHSMFLYTIDGCYLCSGFFGTGKINYSDVTLISCRMRQLGVTTRVYPRFTRCPKVWFGMKLSQGNTRSQAKILGRLKCANTREHRRFCTFLEQNQTNVENALIHVTITR